MVVVLLGDDLKVKQARKAIESARARSYSIVEVNADIATFRALSNNDPKKTPGTLDNWIHDGSRSKETITKRKQAQPNVEAIRNGLRCYLFREDLAKARAAWLETFRDPQSKIDADASDFLRVDDSEGEVLDFHALRHTAASWLIQSGADVKTVQTIMRHSDIKLTLDRYGHLFPGSEADAVKRLESVFCRPIASAATGTDEMPLFYEMRAERLELSTQGLKVQWKHRLYQ